MVLGIGLILVGILALMGLSPLRTVLPLIDPPGPHIVPVVSRDAAEVRTSAPEDAGPPGIEGAILFVRLTDSGGSTVLDRAFAFPSDRQTVPAGEYEVIAYWRYCAGNCGRLDPGESPFCDDRVALTPSSSLLIHVLPSDFGSKCTMSVADA